MLFTAAGRPVDGQAAQVTYAMAATPDGGVECDAELLLGLAGQAIDGLVQGAGPLAARVVGAGISCFWHSLVGIGPDDRAITPVYSWADTRSDGAAAELRARLDEAAVHARTGCLLHPSYLPAKLLWLSRSQPETFRRAARWMSFGEYLTFRLLGESACSISMASGTGLFDQGRCAWDKEILEALELDAERLSPLGDPAVPLTGLQPEFAGRWPALRSAAWFPAVGDGACSNIGSGCVTPERIALMVGTSGAMRVCWEAREARIPPGLWCYRADRRRLVMGGALSAGGDLFAWLHRLLRLEAPEALERSLADMEADGHGLTVLPFPSGERSPGYAAHARAAIVGLTLSTQPAEILRAGLEAVAYRFAAIHARLRAAVPEAREIIASGGALLRSPVWTQIMSDVLGQPVRALDEPEASTRGAALLVLEALGLLADVRDAPARLGQTYRPDPARHERYRRGMARLERAYDVLVRPRPGVE
jgi:gluconokinase